MDLRKLPFLLFAVMGLSSACSAGSGGATGVDPGGSPGGGNLGAPVTDTGETPPGDGKSCEPSCAGKECGSDGCGGQCGACSGKEVCSASGTCETPVPSGVKCPPTGATGSTVGAIIKPGALPLAKGGTYDVRASCAKPIYLLGVTETCGICMQKLGTWTKPGNLFDQLKAEGADVVLVSTDNAQGSPGSPATAEALKKRFALGDRFVVGYEPAGSGVGSPSTHFNGFIPTRAGVSGARIAIILKPGNVIGAVGQVDDPAEIRAALGL